MVMWAGLLAGAILGGLIGGIAGAIALGFLGWLLGVIIAASHRRGASPGAVAAPKPAADRLGEIERRLAAIEARLARFESGAGAQEPRGMAESPAQPTPPPIPAPAESPPPIPPAEAPAQAAARTAPSAARPNALAAWFTAGNAIARIGVVVLFIGVAFLLKYAVDNELVPPAARVGGVGLAGLALLVLGWRLRHSRPGYALSLQGAGVGLAYLAVFGAFRLYALVSTEAAFVLLFAIAALATVLAVRQDSEALAGFGAAGGFLAPVLASAGSGSHVVLFGFYAVLNVAILATAWFKAWRSLNLVGFAFTFLVGLSWGLSYYRPEHFATVEPFLALFFASYLAVSILFARREAGAGGRRVDAVLVFGVPVAAFGLQAGLVADTEYGLAITSLALAAVYAGLFLAMRRRGEPAWRLLDQSFLALAVVFAAIAIPLAFDARWTSASWAIAGAGLVWVGAKRDQAWAQAFGLVLQLAAGVAFVDSWGAIPMDYPVLNGVFLGAVLVAASGMATHLALGAAPEGATKSRGLVASAFLWSLAWWLFALHEDIARFVDRDYETNALLASFAATALVLGLLHRGGRWREAAWPAQALLPVLYAFLALAVIEARHPFGYAGWIAWPFALACHYGLRWRIEDRDHPAKGAFATFQHAGAFVLAAAVGAWELRYAALDAGFGRSAWTLAAAIVVPAWLLVMASSAAARRHWPVGGRVHAYLVAGAMPVALGLWLWVFYANGVRAGPSPPLPYLPLFNGVDLAHALVALAFASWSKALAQGGLTLPPSLRGTPAKAALGAAAFAWANGVLLRSLHEWADVPYRLEAWMRSFVTQASLSVFWTLVAVGLMVFASRRAARGLWMVGAALMAVVLAKLTFVDFTSLGGIERIVSFIGVGVLMLLVGYLSPVPPRQGAPAPD